jgi:cytochrome c peroxidase
MMCHQRNGGSGMRLFGCGLIAAGIASLTLMIGCGAKEQPEEPAPAQATPAVPRQPTETQPKLEAAAEAQSTNQVTLGDPSLTAGIPGEGPVTVAEIEAWLGKPENHETLEIQLPMGLDQGATMIQGLDDNPLTRAKIELGRQLYFDTRLSADNTVSCASCHHPDEGFARQTQFGVGIDQQTGNRNSPVSYNRILSGPQFWDGRAASLEEQAVGPIANPIEMGNTHETCVETVKGVEGYRVQFEKIFPDGVTIDNIGKAIASFERCIVTGPSPFDYYEPVRVLEESLGDALKDLDALKKDEPETYAEYTAALEASEQHPMSESAKRGRDLFFTTQAAGCTACHVGPNLTDEKYHNIGVGMDQEEPDVGRYAVTMDEKDRGAFKTPTIRNVELSAPYMHDGSDKTLEEVVEFYNLGGRPNPQLADGIRKLNLTDEQKRDLVEFMKSCTGEFPPIERGRLPE